MILPRNPTDLDYGFDHYLPTEDETPLKSL